MFRVVDFVGTLPATAFYECCESWPEVRIRVGLGSERENLDTSAVRVAVRRLIGCCDGAFLF